MEIRSYPRRSRDEGDPAPGENFRAPGLPEEPGARRRKSPPNGGDGSNLMMIRVAVLGFIGLAVAGFFVIRGWMDGKEGVPPSGDRSAVPKAAGVKSVAAEIASPDEDGCKALVKKVLAMRHASEFPGKVRLEGMSAAEAEEFLGHLKEKEGAVDHMEWLGPLDANGLQIQAVVVYFAGDTVRSRLAFLVPDKTGAWQLDIASFARWNSMAWQDIVKGPACEAEIRAVCGRGSYFNEGYADEKLWSCYKLFTPDSEQSIDAYCKKGGPEDRAIGAMLRPNRLGPEIRLTRLIIRLKKITGPGSRQCEVASVLAQDWVKTDVAYDERFRKDAPSEAAE